MATSYTSNKKIGALDSASTPLAATNEIVINQNGDILKTPLSAVEAKVFDAKTQTTTPTGTEVTIVRQTDGTLRQVPLANIVPALNITNAQISNSAAIVDTKLDTINTAGKVTNNAVQAVSTNTANRIVTRDGSGNFAAGTITATLSGNASTATILQTGRTLAMTGDVTYTSPSFDGSANVTAASTIANNAVTTAKIADSAVTSAKIADGTIVTADLADGAVTSAKIADGTIVTADLADGAVTSAKIADGTIVTADLADGAVTSAKIADGTIVNADINASAAIAGTKIAPNFGSQNVVTTGLGTFAAVTAAGVYPVIQLTETDASSNNQRWDILADAEGMFVRAVNDAYTAAGNAIEIQRTGTTIDSVSMPNGNVGVGTSSPIVKLDVAGLIRSFFATVIDGAAATWRLVAFKTNNVSRWDVGATSDNETGSNAGSDFFLHRFSDAGSFLERVLHISRSTGNVGIGTSSPSAKLDVNGQTKVTGQLNVSPTNDNQTTKPSFWGGGITTFDVYASGSVGVGTANGSTIRSLMSNDGNAWFTGNVTASTFTGNLTGTASAIADGTVSTAKIVDGSVTTAKLADANVTTAKLATATQQSLVPAGAVMPFARATAPSGWLQANGDVVPNGTGTVQGVTADFSALYAAVSTSFGAAGTLPDLRGIFVRGSGSQTIGGIAYNKAFATKESDALQGHNHSASVSHNAIAASGGGARGSGLPSGAATITVSVSGPTNDGSNGNPRTASETRPANIALLYCIKF